MVFTIDAKDRDILDWLQRDAKLTVIQLAKKTGLPPTTIHNRIKQLEQEGVITNYSVSVDNEKIGLPLSVIILATIQYDHYRTKKFSQKEVARQIKEIVGVAEVLIVTGRTDIIVRANLPSIHALDAFLLDKLRNIEGIDKTETLMVLSRLT